MFGLAPAELALVGSIIGVTIVLIAWTITDIVSWSEDVWKRADQNRAIWIFLPLAGLVILIPPGLGIAFSLAYFATVRPKLQRAAAQSRPG